MVFFFNLLDGLCEAVRRKKNLCEYLFMNKINCNFAVQFENYITLYFMADTKKIKTALVSVFHKDGLEELLKKLNDEGVKFLSTGGTQSFIESLGYACEKVENVTT